MSLLDFLYPKFCIGCGKFGTYCCETCLSNMSSVISKCPVCTKPSIDGQTHIRCRTKYTIDGLLSFYPYTNVVKRVITKTKYQYVYRALQDVLRQTPPCHLQQLCAVLMKQSNNIVIVPIPLHHQRQRMRGFNQSNIIAKWIAAQTGIPINDTMLKRIRPTIPQVEMRTKRERLRNMDHVFGLEQTGAIQAGTTVLLVDDVYTTGATMKSASSLLKHQGICSVWGITVAQ